MYAQKDEYMEEASKTIYQLSQDKNIRLQCEAREDYYRRQRSVQHYIEEQAAQLTEKDSLIAKKESDLRERDSLIAKLQAELELLKTQSSVT